MSTLENRPEREPLSQPELEKALANAKDLTALKQLYDQLSIEQDLVRRIGGDQGRRDGLAELRLRVARKLGLVLGRSVRRGGHGSATGDSPRRGGSSSPLPEGISWSQSSRFQQLAKVSEVQLRRYVDEAKASGQAISLAAALRSLRLTEREASYWDRVLRAVKSTMDVDLCVGVPARQLGAARELLLRDAQREVLRGNVFVSVKRSPRDWLALLTKAIRAGRVAQAMLLFEAKVGAPWFRMVALDNWSCCFLARPAGASTDRALAYRGDHRLRFWQVFHRLGTVVEPAGIRSQPSTPDPDADR